MTPVRRLLPVALLLSTWLLALGARTPDSLVRVRELYLAAVEKESAIELGLQAIDELRGSGGAPVGSDAEAVLSAYHGALITLRAKHGVWPPARLRHLREGLAILDRAVAARPEEAEIRYLRLLSCYFLPGILGREESVREDFDALAILLPGARASFPPDLYDDMLRFVLERGRVGEAQRARLQDALDALPRG